MKGKRLKAMTLMFLVAVLTAAAPNPPLAHSFVIGKAKASGKEIRKVPRIYSSASAFINQYNKYSNLGPLESYAITKKVGVIKLHASLGAYGSMTGVVNADKSLKNIIYQQPFAYYSQETLDKMKESVVEGDRGVEIALTIDTLLAIFSPHATKEEKQAVSSLFDHTPRVKPAQASWRTAKIGDITYSLHMTEEGLCSFKVAR